MERKIKLDELNVVIYHKGCQDGTTAAHIFKYECEKYYNPIELIASGHEGNEIKFDEIKDKNVIMVDLVTDNIEQVFENAKQLCVLDHHKSAIKKYSHLDYCYFDVTKCGATIAYEYVFFDQELPYFIKCIQARDLWTWDIDRAEEFTTGYFKKSETDNLYEIFKKLMPTDDEELLNEIINIGAKLIKSKKKLINEHALKVQINTIKIKGDESNKEYNIIKYEVDQELCKIRSDFGNHCMKTFDIDFIVMYHYAEGSESYNCSLRSIEGKTDLVENNIAQGHPLAAGITLSIHPDKHFYNI